METRANYVAVGAFVLALAAALFIAVLWLAHIQFEQPVRHFQTHMPAPVTGLNIGGPVRFNGLEVGRVGAITLDPEHPREVVLTLDITAEAPIKTDSEASLEIQGLTGTSYVEISGGTQEAPLLTALPGQPYPVIPSHASVLQVMSQGAPELFRNLNTLSERLGHIVDEDNRKALAQTLGNLRDVSATIAAHHGDIDSMLADGAVSMNRLKDTTQALNKTLADLQQVLAKAKGMSGQADQLLVSADEAAKEIGALAKTANAALGENRDDLRAFTAEGLPQLSRLVGQMRGLVDSLDRVSNDLDRDPQRLLFGDPRKGYTPK